MTVIGLWWFVAGMVAGSVLTLIAVALAQAGAESEPTDLDWSARPASHTHLRTGDANESP